MKEFIQIKIHSSLQAMNEELIAMLSEYDFYAFEETDFFLMAYINAGDFKEEILKEILQPGIHYEIITIPDQNWNNAWEKNFQPVMIEHFAGIRAAFHEPMKNVAHEIIITPKMSFGTGHHATTFLMVQIMERIDFINKKVLDFGTGTGVLAILAEKLKASSVVAIDNDEWSIENAFENIEANSCKNVLIEKRDNINGLSHVDIILANINYNVLKDAARVFSALLQPASLLLISGILVKDEASLVAEFGMCGLVKKQMMQQAGWLAILFQKQ